VSRSVLDLDILDQDRIGVCIEIGFGLKLGDPAPEDLVADDALTGFVIELEDDVLTEVGKRRLAAEAGAEVPHLVRPLLEIFIVRHAALERDRVVFGSPWGLARARRIATLAVLDHLRRALERADLANPGDVFAVPLHLKLEVLVGVEALGVDAELSHGASPRP
jgi:hypothetical protein